MEKNLDVTKPRYSEHVHALHDKHHEVSSLKDFHQKAHNSV